MGIGFKLGLCNNDQPGNGIWEIKLSLIAKMLDCAFVLWYYLQMQQHYTRLFILQQLYCHNYDDNTSKLKDDILVIPIMHDKDVIIEKFVKKLKMIVNVYCVNVGLNLILVVLLCLILLMMLHGLKIAQRHKYHCDVPLIDCDFCCCPGWTETTHEKRKR